MRERRDAWKWPVVGGLALSLLSATIFLMPRSWLDFLLAPQARVTTPVAPPAAGVLTLLPPLEFERISRPAAERPPVPPRAPPPLATDPRWWTEGWLVAGVKDTALFSAPAAVAVDTLGRVLAALGLGADFMTRARPDSVVASRLSLLRLQDGFRFDELKPFLLHMARARAYADILSRAADMYDEPLDREVRVPD